MPKIASINCHKVLNSRADWTIETHVTLDDGSVGIQTIPDGASKGEREAVTVPVSNAVENVATVFNDALKGKDPLNQIAIDSILIDIDGTPNKSKLGANSILSISQATAKASAMSKKMELWEYLSLLYKGKPTSHSQIKFPTPVFNILNGGKHARNNLAFQELMVIPSKKYDIQRAIEIGVDIYDLLKLKLEGLNLDVAVGDEGGFAPTGLTIPKAFSLIREAAAQKYKVGEDVFFGSDAAAESFYKDGKYLIAEENLVLTGEELTEYYIELTKKFELIYLEDPFYENDAESWAKIFTKLSSKLMIVGDDLVVTNASILEKAINDKLLNAVIVKPNQVGTVTETFDFIKLAKKHNLATILSHRSGDTAEDTFIADLAVAVDSEFMKSGAPARGERVAKYNRLLEIYNS